MHSRKQTGGLHTSHTGYWVQIFQHSQILAGQNVRLAHNFTLDAATFIDHYREKAMAILLQGPCHHLCFKTLIQRILKEKKSLTALSDYIFDYV